MNFFFVSNIPFIDLVQQKKGVYTYPLFIGKGILFEMGACLGTAHHHHYHHHHVPHHHHHRPHHHHHGGGHRHHGGGHRGGGHRGH